MTKEEKEFYENIKNDPENPLFEMLFQKNSLGNIVSKAGITFKLMGDGLPFVMNEVTANLYSGNFTIGDPLERARRDNAFENISNEVAMDSPFGKKSTFYIPPKEEFSLSSKHRISKGLKRS